MFHLLYLFLSICEINTRLLLPNVFQQTVIEKYIRYEILKVYQSLRSGKCFFGSKVKICIFLKKNTNLQIHHELLPNYSQFIVTKCQIHIYWNYDVNWIFRCIIYKDKEGFQDFKSSFCSTQFDFRACYFYHGNWIANLSVSNTFCILCWRNV